ncbi:MAG: glycosyltransferase [Parasphingorhabdus sp.]|nr:glycosyltransferase [Parasphingorhabdus sp.]
MRIVDVCEFYAPHGGGVRTYVDRKMQLLAELGHELIVLAPATEDSIEERETGGKIIWIKAPAMPFDANYRMFWDAAPVHAWLDRLNPDVVEASSPWRPTWIVGKWPGNAVKIMFMHNDPVVTYPYRWFGRIASRERIDTAFEWYNRYLRRAIPLYDDVLVCGPSLQKRLALRDLGDISCIPLGIDRAGFSPTLRDETLRTDLLAQCDLPENATLLIGVGRHHPEKRWSLIIDAVQSAATDRPIGLILIGKGMESAALEKQVGANPHIRLFRPVYDRPQLARLLASSDALIHGSEGEPFGLVVSEALASGLPMIVPHEGGCAEVAQPEFSESFVSNDVSSARDAILRLCNRDWSQLRAAAREAAMTVRSDRDHVSELATHYAALVDIRATEAA